ncbi:MAG: helix-turn-helix transcriptional regulator [Lachnospiraceae bacterium]|nr:helix-turn-helix transcriptional regulator [Lachnospiraceae bacterium]
MKNRIKEIRKMSPYGKTQDTFSEFLGIPKSNLASYEIGRRVPSDAAIQLICQKCGINEEWLRNGTPPMKPPDKLSTYLAQIKKGDEEFIKELIEVYMELDPDSKKALRIIADKMHEKRKERGQ